MSGSEKKERTMKWPKDRKKAFLWAAEAFGTPLSERTERQGIVTFGGICYAIEKLTNSRDSYYWVCDFGRKMHIGHTWWWPIRRENGWTPSCDDERSLFCCLMAQLSDKEFEEISG